MNSLYALLCLNVLCGTIQAMEAQLAPPVMDKCCTYVISDDKELPSLWLPPENFTTAREWWLIDQDGKLVRVGASRYALEKSRIHVLVLQTCHDQPMLAFVRNVVDLELSGTISLVLLTGNLLPGQEEECMSLLLKLITRNRTQQPARVVIVQNEHQMKTAIQAVSQTLQKAQFPIEVLSVTEHELNAVLPIKLHRAYKAAGLLHIEEIATKPCSALDSVLLSTVESTLAAVRMWFTGLPDLLEALPPAVQSYYESTHSLGVAVQNAWQNQENTSEKK